MTDQSNVNAVVNNGLSPEEEREKTRQRILRVGILRGSIHLWSLGLKERSEVEKICRATLAMFPDVQEAIDFLATSETVIESPM